MITYQVFARGYSNANNCPAVAPNDPDVPIQATVQVNWLAVGAEQNSIITVSQPKVVADGQSAATVTVVLTDPSGMPLSNQRVRLTGTGSALVTPTVVKAGLGGQAAFTLTDTNPIALTIGAQRYNGAFWQQINARAKLTFVSPSQSELADTTVTASLARVNADGVSTSTVVASLADSSGPLAGHQVTLTRVNGAAIIGTAQGRSDAGGRAIFTVSDSTAETVTFNARDHTATGAPIVGSVRVRFGAVANSEQALSQLSLTPSGAVATSSTVPDDGTTAAGVFVQLRCDDIANGCNGAGTQLYGSDVGGPTGTVVGAQVGLVATSSTSATVTQILDPTNFDGETRFQITDTVPEQVTFNAFDLTNNVELASVDDTTTPPNVTPLKVTINFTGPGTPSATTSSAVASPSTVADDGVSASTITVTLRIWQPARGARKGGHHERRLGLLHRQTVAGGDQCPRGGGLLGGGHPRRAGELLRHRHH